MQKALSYRPGHVTALVTSGANQANLGRYGLAMRDFEAALLLDPECANARKYLQSTREKANQVRDISTITAVAQAQRQQEEQERQDRQQGREASSHNRSSSTSGGARDAVLLKAHKSIPTSCSTGDQTWSYVLDEDICEDFEDSARSKHKKKKVEKSQKKKNKKSDKKRKHKKDKSSSRSSSKKSKKKSRGRSRDTRSADSSSSEDSSSLSSGSEGEGRGGSRKKQRSGEGREGLEYHQSGEEELHPILARSKHKLWD